MIWTRMFTQVIELSGGNEWLDRNHMTLRSGASSGTTPPQKVPRGRLTFAHMLRFTRPEPDSSINYLLAGGKN